MSALTKVFIVLLVVCALLFVSGTVVFVNRQENLTKATKDLKDINQTLSTKVAEAQTSLMNEKSRGEKDRQLANEQIRAVEQSRDQYQQQLADKDVQIANLNKDLAMRALDLNKVTEGLAASEQQKGQMLATVADYRKLIDDQTKRIADLNGALNDVTRFADQADRSRRSFQEQLTQSQGRMTTLEKFIKDAGLDVGQATGASSGLRRGAPAIVGTITDVKDIAGVPYATIGVGSADEVQKGMQFTVIDKARGEFLGFLTVESVQPQEAVGRLSGPKLDQVKTGVEVRTQL